MADIAGPKLESMQFRGMIKLKFFKSMQNKITKKCHLYFSFILNLKKKKITWDENDSTVRRRKKKKEK